MLNDYIFTYDNILSEHDHSRLLELCNNTQFPIGDQDDRNNEAYYKLTGERGEILLEQDDEIYYLIHKGMLKTMPKIYTDYSEINPPDSPLYDKYSGYWLCKYDVGGHLSIHTDCDADAASITASFNINDDYEGGEVCFWGNTNMPKHANSIHVYPSNMLYPHEVKPVTKGVRYSVIVWFGYQKGNNWE